MYTGMLDVSVKDKNLEVPCWELTESCPVAFSKLIFSGTNML
jgi:hypothetical protein